MTTLPISLPTRAIAGFCEQYGITRMSLFVSVLREDFGPGSDVDILVEFDPDRRFGLVGFPRMQYELSDMLGRRVDLNTPEDLGPKIIDAVKAEARPIHVAA